MEIRHDILTDDDGDLVVKNADLATGASDEQHVIDILRAEPGQYKQYPLMGASIINAKNGALDGVLRKNIRVNLESDGYFINTLTQDETGINIDFEQK